MSGPLLYRSPDHLIDGFVWHVAVMRVGGARKACVVHRFRKHSARRENWRNITTWPGKLPKGLKQFFARYQKHIAEAKTGIPIPST